jgi:hypothetical protein
MIMRPDYPIERIAACAYRVPTETPEEDGTHAWTATTLVVVHSSAGGRQGMGYSYGSAAMVPLIHELLAPRVVHGDAFASDDFAGLRLLRDRVPAPVAIAAGEYGYEPLYFRTMLEAGAVDVLQADASRCLGITGFLAASRLCEVFHVPLSAHTAPSLHAHVACCSAPLVHLEYFHDHARLEARPFDGFREPRGGLLAPDPSRPGIGVELKRAEAEAFAVRGENDAATA